MNYRTYLFDFDYTLADATEGIVACVHFAFKNLGLIPPGEYAVRKTVGLTLTETFEALTGCGDPQRQQEFARLFVQQADRVMTAGTRLFPDTVPTLRRIKGAGCRTGIVTSKNRYRIEEALKLHSLTELVDTVVGFEDVENSKPHPEGIFLAMSRFGAEPAQTLYTGDSTVDARTADAAGVDFYAVTTGATAADELYTYPCMRVGATLTDLFGEL